MKDNDSYEGKRKIFEYIMGKKLFHPIHFFKNSFTFKNVKIETSNVGLPVMVQIQDRSRR